MTSPTPRDELLSNAPFAFPESVLSFYNKNLVEACNRMTKRIDWSTELLAQTGKVARSNNETALATARIAAEAFRAFTTSAARMYQSAFTGGLEISRTLSQFEHAGERSPAGSESFNAQSALETWLKPSQNVAQMFINATSRLPDPSGIARPGSGRVADAPAKSCAHAEPRPALH